MGGILAITNSDALKTDDGVRSFGETSAYTWTVLLLPSIVSVIVVYIFRKVIDRKSLLSLGFEFSPHKNEAIAGLLLGIVLLGTGSLILYFNNNLRWIDINFHKVDFFIGLLLMLIVAVGEEMVIRGYVLNNLMDSFNKWVSLIISALLFAMMHSSNPDINAIAFINLFVAGILLGVNYIFTRNLWFAIFLHFSWNFFQGVVLGYDVSGVDLQSILSHELQGNPLLTGGAFGFEGSILSGLLCATAFLSLHFFYRNHTAKQ